MLKAAKHTNRHCFRQSALQLRQHLRRPHQHKYAVVVLGYYRDEKISTFVTVAKDNVTETVDQHWSFILDWFIVTKHGCQKICKSFVVLADVTCLFSALQQDWQSGYAGRRTTCPSIREADFLHRVPVGVLFTERVGSRIVDQACSRRPVLKPETKFINLTFIRRNLCGFVTTSIL